MPEFKEPKPNPIVIIAVKIMLPFWLRFKEHLSIHIRGNQPDLDAFSKRRRAVILLNHPDRQDPFVLFELANHMHEQFYCIAARECFDWDFGMRGWLFQNLGCYSVNRGRADFHSIATTEKILRQGGRKLVVFPEGEITADEDNVQELQKTTFHILLDVQKQLSEGPSIQADECVAIIPAAIRFKLKGDLKSAVGPALKKIEARLAVHTNPDSAELLRIKTVIDAYLGWVFDAYGLEKVPADLEELPVRAAVAMLQKIASRLGANWDDTLSPTDQLYAVRNKVDGNDVLESIALAPKTFHCAGFARPSIRSDLERIERLLILARMLLNPSSEIQCCRALDFIESELFGVITPKGWQSCVVFLGTPIDVSAFVETYTASKEKGVMELSEHFRQKLQSMLQSM